MNIQIEKKEKSVVMVTGVLLVADIEKRRDFVMSDLRENVEIAGFRKGAVPDAMIVSKFGDLTIWTEMAQTELEYALFKILSDNSLEPLARPQVTLTKIAAGSDVEFKLEVVVRPEVVLPESLEKIAASIEKKEAKKIEEKDIEDVLLNLRRMKAHEIAHKNDPNHTHDHTHGEDAHDHELPDLNDAFAVSLGGSEKTVDDLRKAIEKDLVEHRAREAKESFRAALLEKIVAETVCDAPDLFIENELSRMIQRVRSDIANMHMEWGTYLADIGKTEKEMRAELTLDAEKRVKAELSLLKISEEKDIKPDMVKIAEEVEVYVKQYPDANKENIQAYFDQIYTNEAVLVYLETL